MRPDGRVEAAATNDGSRAAHPALHVLTLFVLLLCLMPPLGVLNGAEEHYFGLASHAVWGSVPRDTALFDGSHQRLLTDVLLGALIAGLGFENAQIVARATAALAYALLLRSLFRGFGLALRDAALVVIVFALLGQSLMGGEWLFGGFEAKIIAYGLVLAGLARAAGARSLGIAVVLFALATYFDMLVGGFWFIAAMAGRLVQDRHDLARVARATRLYFLLAVPLIAVLAWTSFNEAPSHAAAFLSGDAFAAPELRGLLLAASMLAFCLIVARLPAARQWRPTAIWLAGLLAYLFLALALAFAARGTGLLGTVEPLRPAALILLLWLTFAAACLGSLATSRWAALRLVALSVLAPLFLLWSAQRLDAAREPAGVAAAKRALADVLAQQAAPEAVVLIDPQIEAFFLDFERRTGHPTLVMDEFKPTSAAEIAQWRRRIEFRRLVFERGCPPSPAYPIDFLLATRDRSPVLMKSCAEPIYATDELALWRVAR